MLAEKNFFKYLLILFISFSFSSKIFGQNRFFRAPECNIRRGFIIPHHKSIQYLAKGFVSSAEVSLGFRSDTSKIWQKVHRFPIVGMGFMFSDFNNPQILGKAYSTFFFIRHPIFERKKFSVNYKFAEGIAYLTKHFDTGSNVFNTVIGSHFNIHIFAGFETEINLTRNIKFLAGIGITHYSNGAIKIPNQGINLVGISAGVILDKNRSKKLGNLEKIPFQSITNYFVILTTGVHQLDIVGKKEYIVGSVSAEYSKQITAKFARGGGLDLFFDQALEPQNISETDTDTKKKDPVYPGLHISGDYVFGKVSFTMQFGTYLLWRPYTYQYVYSRFGFRYKFSKHLLANITLKTYFSAADFIEFGFGYCF